jgi:hypothetical protein
MPVVNMLTRSIHPFGISSNVPAARARAVPSKKGQTSVGSPRPMVVIGVPDVCDTTASKVIRGLSTIETEAAPRHGRIGTTRAGGGRP